MSLDAKLAPPSLFTLATSGEACELCFLEPWRDLLDLTQLVSGRVDKREAWPKESILSLMREYLEGAMVHSRNT